MTHRLTIRFFGRLNDFLPAGLRNRGCVYTIKGHPAVKDTLEAAGVPHPEIAVILVDGQPVRFDRQTDSDAKVRGYPPEFATRFPSARPLCPRYRGRPRFVVDSHLGKLARHLRLLGFDCVYRTDFPDEEIARISEREKRIVLTRDVGLLKNKAVCYGTWVRSVDPRCQLKDMARLFGLDGYARPFTLCLDCNGRVTRVAKQRVEDRLPEQVRAVYNEFYVCRRCRKVYWKGTHYAQLTAIVRRVAKKTPSSTVRRHPRAPGNF
jgi:uncharacterized protein with PIN domain